MLTPKRSMAEIISTNLLMRQAFIDKHHGSKNDNSKNIVFKTIDSNQQPPKKLILDNMYSHNKSN